MSIEWSFFEVATNIAWNPGELVTVDLRKANYRNKIAFVIGEWFEPQIKGITENAIGIDFVLQGD